MPESFHARFPVSDISLYSDLRLFFAPGRARSKTKYSPKGQLNEKIFMLWPRKIQTRNLITKKIPAARKFPTPPPITFLMVRPLGLKRGCQAFLAENVETGTKNRCVIEATHVLRRKLRKD